MRPAAAAASLVLAGLCACAGYTGGTTRLDDGGVPTGLGGGDGGDGGVPDGGDAGPADAGDAGCADHSRNTTTVTDFCASTAGMPGTGSISVNTASCTVQIGTTTSTGQCTGTVSGASDAFDGGCGGFTNCNSASLPGTIVCVTGPSSSCSIVVDGGP